MCDGLEIPFFHRVIALHYSSDLPGDTFSALLQRANTQGKPASVIPLALDDDEIQRRSAL